MILRIIAVGRLKESHWREGVADYILRIKPYARLELVEVPEARIQGGTSASLLDRLAKEEDLLIALDRQGRELDSQQMADLIAGQMLEGRKAISWVIGGPLGLSPSVLERADMVLSFSKLTFPHQMMRLILLEQIYRSFCIISRRPYHK